MPQSNDDDVPICRPVVDSTSRRSLAQLQSELVAQNFRIEPEPAADRYNPCYGWKHLPDARRDELNPDKPLLLIAHLWVFPTGATYSLEIPGHRHDRSYRLIASEDDPALIPYLTKRLLAAWAAL